MQPDLLGHVGSEGKDCVIPKLKLYAVDAFTHVDRVSDDLLEWFKFNPSVGAAFLPNLHGHVVLQDHFDVLDPAGRLLSWRSVDGDASALSASHHVHLKHIHHRKLAKPIAVLFSVVTEPWVVHEL